ncbi:fibronectin type III domain-containing protein [Fibrivirga algicola]|uniref:Fibronectin type III domain-containing protein n=1 Tax=Fibrivirga algicola TaxID=2950420 RepID=A0ABX0QTB1_9BACT|nr:fibronectin type III domain-containing protein [Fibrivirga algicola]NID13788.1 fibronectin type III domain-containing protein [Fibrivirga algicola]
MNAALLIDEPAGADWTFSLDPDAPTSAYQPDRLFLTQYDGSPFVNGQSVVVYAYHAATNKRLVEAVTYWSGPDDYALKPDQELPNLAQITRRGADTPHVLSAHNFQSSQFPTLTRADQLFVGFPQPGGFVRFALITLADLAHALAPLLNLGDVAPLPDYLPVRIWRFVPDSNALPDYVPVRIWRFVPDTALTRPAAPTDLAVVIDSDGRYRLEFTDNANNEAAVLIVRATADGAFAPYVSIPPNTTLTGYLPDIQPGVTYRFQAQAINGAGSSGWSNVATINPAPVVPTITKMEITIVSGPAPKNTQALHPTLSSPDEVEWQWVQANGAVIIDWSPRFPPAPFQANDYTHSFDTGVVPGSPGAVMYLKARPKSNPTAVVGPYAAQFGGTALYDWTIIFPQS